MRVDTPPPDSRHTRVSSGSPCRIACLPTAYIRASHTGSHSASQRDSGGQTADGDDRTTTTHNRQPLTGRTLLGGRTDYNWPAPVGVGIAGPIVLLVGMALHVVTPL